MRRGSHRAADVATHGTDSRSAAPRSASPTGESLHGARRPARRTRRTPRSGRPAPSRRASLRLRSTVRPRLPRDHVAVIASGVRAQPATGLCAGLLDPAEERQHDAARRGEGLHVHDATASTFSPRSSRHGAHADRAYGAAPDGRSTTWITSAVSDVPPCKWQKPDDPASEAPEGRVLESMTRTVGRLENHGPA